MGLFNRKTKQIFKRIKKQEINLDDGSQVQIKVKPKFGQKTKVEVSWNKSIDDIDFYVSFKGQPIRISKDGCIYNPDGEEYAKFEVGVKSKF